MPELPEVETVRRMLHDQVRGLTVATARRSRQALRNDPVRSLAALRGLRLDTVDRHGKYLMFRFSGGRTLLSHLGMSGRWLFARDGAANRLPHVHADFSFADGSALRYQDPRRFGQLRILSTARAAQDPSLAMLGPDPIHTPPDGASLAAQGMKLRTNIKSFLLDQRRIAGIGNIYASEILFRTGTDPRRATSSLDRKEWEAIARVIPEVLGEAIARMGTTFSTYRTLWNEPGQFGEQLRVYDRSGEPCRSCGSAVRRIVQAGRSTFFCPRCQPQRHTGSRK